MGQRLIKAFLGFIVAFGLLATPLLHAQSDWPKSKPVTLLVAFAPGSSTDIVARTLAPKLNELTGGNFIVENKGGAGGNIASMQVKRSAADGYTVLVHSVAYAVNPSLYADAGYDALKDFAAVALGPKTPNIITANPSVTAKTLPICPWNGSNRRPRLTSLMSPTSLPRPSMRWSPAIPQLPPLPCHLPFPW